MALRLVEIRLPADAEEDYRSIVEEHSPREAWKEPGLEVATGDEGEEMKLLRFNIVLEAEEAEPLLDDLEKSFASREGFRMLLLPVEASIPRPEPEEEEGDEDEPTEPGAEGEEEEDEGATHRVSREELYEDLSDGASLNSVYVVMIALSAVVCAFGLLTGDVAVIIGAMVIAPLLGPLTSISLATTLADVDLALRSVRTAAVGLATAFVLSVLMGAIFPVDPGMSQIAYRSQVGLANLGLALAAGAAGTLAFTGGVAEAVIGVMVAVALVPPLVTAGLLVGAGYTGQAVGATVLTFTNLIGVNLAGVATFVLQGVRPNRWWEARRAKRATAWALAIWTIMLLALAAVIVWGGF